MLQRLSAMALPFLLLSAPIPAPGSYAASAPGRANTVALASAPSQGAGTAWSPTVGLSQPPRQLRFVLAATGNEARYRVHEQLLTLTMPSEAVGKTTKLEGSLVIGTDGKIGTGSKFVVDLASIASDRPNRDNYVRENTLETAKHPSAEFVPVSATGLPARLPAAGDLTFDLIGNLTLHGVTKPCTWKVKAKMSATGESSGTATTFFKFADFSMAQPRVVLVLSVADSITLEYDFHLIPEPTQPRGGSK